MDLLDVAHDNEEQQGNDEMVNSDCFKSKVTESELVAAAIQINNAVAKPPTTKSKEEMQVLVDQLNLDEEEATNQHFTISEQQQLATNSNSTNHAILQLVEEQFAVQTPTTFEPRKKQKTAALPAAVDARNGQIRTSWPECIAKDNTVRECAQDGTWLQCKFCVSRKGNFRLIKVHRAFGTTEWFHHRKCETHRRNTSDIITVVYPRSPQHNQKSISNKATPKSKSARSLSKMDNDSANKIIREKCQGFYSEKNQTYLQLFVQYGKYDDLGLQIVCSSESNWTVHSLECNHFRPIKRPRSTSTSRRNACEACFSFPSLRKFRRRLDRMNKVYEVLSIIRSVTPLEATSQEAELLSNFLKVKDEDVNKNRVVLMENCKKYLAYFKWYSKNKDKILAMEAEDLSGVYTI